MVFSLVPCKVAYVSNAHQYPPFKDGLYLEEYFLMYMWRRGQRQFDRHGRRYLPVLWLNVRTHPLAARMKPALQRALDLFAQRHPCDAGFFAVVQHDDGTDLQLPPNTLVYGAGGSGDVPIPLIYEDRNDTLRKAAAAAAAASPCASPSSVLLCSFVGSATHGVRERMVRELTSGAANQAAFDLRVRAQWTAAVAPAQAAEFVEATLAAPFALAPRGYGRTSFRLYEILQLGRVPVYVFDDEDPPEGWLPYKEWVDYATFVVCVRASELAGLRERLLAIVSTPHAYGDMLAAARRHRHVFQLQFMCEYITDGTTRALPMRRTLMLPTAAAAPEKRLQIALRSAPADSIVWTTLLNAGYLDYARNFLRSVERERIFDFRLLFFCLDDESLALQAESRHALCIDARFLFGDGGQALRKELQVWDTREYKRIVFGKLDVLRVVLQAAAAAAAATVHIGYMDMDVVLRRNPDPELLLELQRFPDADLFSQCDEPRAECADRARCANICSGVLLVRGGGEPARRLLPLLRYDLERDAARFHGDQDFLLAQIHAAPSSLAVRYRTLDKDKFRNGSSCCGAWEDSPPPQCVLVHFNYCVGNQKKEIMQRMHMWHI